MPKVDVFSAFKESDKLSQNIRQLQNNVKGLTTDINEYRQIANKAFDKRKEIKLDITKAKTELKELEKAYQNGDKTAEKSYKNKQKHLDLLNEEYRRLGTVIADSSKAEKKLADDISRNNNKNSSRDIKGTMKSLAKSDLAGMVVDSVSGFATQAISSAYGISAGEAVGDIVGGAASGAAIGTAILPGVGTAIGGAIGALTGAINTMTKQLEKKDDIFREEVQNIVSMVEDQKQKGIENGVELYKQRDNEINKLSGLLGTKINGEDFYNKINSFGINTPYKTENVLDAAKNMLTKDIREDKIFESIKLIGDVAAGDSEKFSVMAEAFTQVQANGKLSGEYLEQLSNRNFDILSVLAEENKTTVEAMRQQMNAGLISTDDVIKAFKIATNEGGNYHNAMDDMMLSYVEKEKQLMAIKNESDIAYGQGYAKVEEKGIDNELSLYQGEFGEDLKSVKGYVGEYEASIKNKHNQTILDAQINLFKNNAEYKEYKEIASYSYDNEFEADKAIRAGITQEMIEEARIGMGELLYEVIGDGEAKWRDSPEHQKTIEQSTQLAEAVQDALRASNHYIDLLLEKSDVLSRGKNKPFAEELEEKTKPWREKRDARSKEATDSLERYLNGGNAWLQGNGSATGLRRVPFDNMPAILHEGERVLTRIEADNLDRIKNKPPTNITLQVSANTSNPYQLAQILYSELKNAMENYGGA